MNVRTFYFQLYAAFGFFIALLWTISAASNSTSSSNTSTQMPTSNNSASNFSGVVTRNSSSQNDQLQNETQPVSSNGSLSNTTQTGAKKPIIRTSAERRLLETLLTDYQVLARPVLNISEKVLISVDIDILHLIRISEIEQIIRISAWMYVTWHDDFLHWDPKDYDGLTKIVLHPESVWLPDFVVMNSAEKYYEEMHYLFHRPIVYSDGSMVWGTGGIYTFKCQIDVTYFPFDDQVCTIHLGNWAYDGSTVNLTYGATGVSIASFSPNSEWDLVATAVERKDHYYFCCPEPYPEVAFIMQWHRKPQYYAINIIAPCCLLTIMGVVVFKVPHESGERLSMGITILLAYTVFQLVIADSIPKTSDSTPLLGSYLLAATATSTVTVVVSVFTLKLHSGEMKHSPPDWLLRLTCCYKGKRKRLRSCRDNHVHASDTFLGPEREPEIQSDERRWETTEMRKRSGSVDSIITHDPRDVYRPDCQWCPTCGEASRTEADTASTLNREEEEKKTELVAEWRTISSAIDNIGFWVCVCFMFVMTIVCFVIIPAYKPDPPLTFFYK